MSRARWLALGSSLVVAGCGGVADPTSNGRSGEQGSTDGAVDTGQPIAQGGDSGAARDDAGQASDSSQTVLADAAEASACTASTAPFACGTQMCDPSSQFCQMYSWGGGTCFADDAGLFPAQCYSCPTCTCVAPTLSASCHCLDLDGGGIGIQCAGCYGSPPTRLELLVA